MFELILIALFGSLAISPMFVGGSDDETDEGTPASGEEVDEPQPPEEPEPLPPEEPSEPVIGRNLTLDDVVDRAIAGGEGDDTLVLDGNSRNSDGEQPDVFRVDLGGGNDTTVMTRWESPDTYGGEGDDDLTVMGYEAQIYGGAGNDMLTSGTGGKAYGGDGDDVLTFEGTTNGYSTSSNLYGGDGDDTLNVSRVLGVSSQYDRYSSNEIVIPESDEAERDLWAFAGLYGGDGADTFNVELSSSPYPDPSPDTPKIVRITSVSDFEPGEDVLIIDLTEMEREGRTMTSFDLTNSETGSSLELVFEGTDDLSGVVGTISFFGAPNVTMDDIVFRGA